MIAKLKMLQVLIAIFFVCEIPVPGANSNEKTAYDFYLSGNCFYNDGKYDEAIRAFEKSVQLDLDFYYARNNLGVAMARKREFKQAVQQFTFCIEEKYGSEAERFVFNFNRILAGREYGRSTEKDWRILKKLDPVRAGKLQNSKDYILMDTFYSQRMSTEDKDRLFQEHKASVAKGKIIVRKIPGHRHNAEEYHAIGLIEGTLDEVAGVLTDYKHYPEFMPNIEEITIKSSDREEFVVDHKLGLPMGVVKKYRLKYWAQKESDRVQLFWKKLPRPELKPKETVIDTWGQWILEEYSEDDHHILAYYRVYTDPGKIPFGMGWIVDILTKESIPNIIKQTKHRVKQMAESTKP